jgi:predicted peptidase
MRMLHVSIWLLIVNMALVMPVLADDGAKAKSKQQEKSFEKEITIKVKLNYLLYLPEGYDAQGEKRWPMILFLHGAGESGEDLSKVKIHGIPKLVETGKDFPFVVVSPQSPRGGWSSDNLSALLDDVISKNKVDKERIYLTGLSMGGFGTWSLATAHPERFAAIAPICGGGNPARADRLKGLPIWAFHGAKDDVVPLSASESMIKALKAIGENPKFTVYPEAKHDSWTETYDNPELYTWFLEHSLANRSPK